MSMDTAVQGNTLLSGEDTRLHQYRFVKLDAQGRVIRCTVAGEAMVGVCRVPGQQGVANEPVGYVFGGVHPVIAGAAITPNQRVTTDAQGRAIPAAAGNVIAGTALTPAAAAGEHVEVQFGPVAGIG